MPAALGGGVRTKVSQSSLLKRRESEDPREQKRRHGLFVPAVRVARVVHRDRSRRRRGYDVVSWRRRRPKQDRSEREDFSAASYGGCAMKFRWHASKVQLGPPPRS